MNDLSTECIVTLPERVETSDWSTVNVSQSALAFNIAMGSGGQLAAAFNGSWVHVSQ